MAGLRAGRKDEDVIGGRDRWRMYELVGWIDEGCDGNVVGLRASRKAGLETEQGIDEMEGSMGGLMDGEGAD